MNFDAVIRFTDGVFEADGNIDTQRPSEKSPVMCISTVYSVVHRSLTLCLRYVSSPQTAVLVAN